MAKINGVEIKNLKKFKGHEGESLCQGNVYVDGKKIGSWSMDARGGMDHFDFDTSVIEERAKQYQSGFPDTYKYKHLEDSPEVFMNELVFLKETERQVKMILKHNPACVYLTDGVHAKFTGRDVDFEATETEMADLKKGLIRSKSHTVHLFKNLSEFNLTIDADHPIPDWMLLS